MVAQSVYMLVFRVVHILSGVFWVGSAFLFAAFVGPAAGELGPAAFPMMLNLVEKRKVPKVILSVATFTVTGGLFLYWHDWHAIGSFKDWIGSAFGVVLTVGALCAITAYFIGWRGIGKSVERIVAIGVQVGASGGPPSPEQAAEMERIGHRLELASKIDLALLVTAVLAMATARYW